MFEPRRDLPTVMFVVNEPNVNVNPVIKTRDLDLKQEPSGKRSRKKISESTGERVAAHKDPQLLDTYSR